MIKSIRFLYKFNTSGQNIDDTNHKLPFYDTLNHKWIN